MKLSLSFVGLSSESTQFLSQHACFILILLCSLLGILNLIFELSDFFRELSLEVFQLLFDLLQLDIKIILLLLFLIILLIESSKFVAVLLLSLFKV
jgi:hypothetical protein